MSQSYDRVLWWSDLRPGADEPLAVSLLHYRMDADRWPVDEGHEDEANLTSSYLRGTKLHAPILDLDGEHLYVESTTELRVSVPQLNNPNVFIRARAKFGVLLVHVVWKWLFGAQVSKSGAV